MGAVRTFIYLNRHSCGARGKSCDRFCICHGSFFIFLCDRKHRADVDVALLLLFYFSFHVLCFPLAPYFSRNSFSVEALSQRLICTLFSWRFFSFILSKNENDREKHKTINTRRKKTPTPEHFTKVNLNAYNACIEMVRFSRNICPKYRCKTHRDHGTTTTDTPRRAFS